VVYEKARTVLINSAVDDRKTTTSPDLETDRRNFSERKQRFINDSSYLDTLKVAWVNGLSLIGVLWTPLAFSYVVEESSYDLAWIISAAITLVFVITPVKLLK
jgi:hypothetical protein